MWRIVWFLAAVMLLTGCAGSAPRPLQRTPGRGTLHLFRTRGAYWPHQGSGAAVPPRGPRGPDGREV
jgi:hypothetical protein